VAIRKVCTVQKARTPAADVASLLVRIRFARALLLTVTARAHIVSQ
jgi:hypothetical protein